MEYDVYDLYEQCLREEMSLGEYDETIVRHYLYDESTVQRYLTSVVESHSTEFASAR